MPVPADGSSSPRGKQFGTGFSQGDVQGSMTVVSLKTRAQDGDNYFKIELSDSSTLHIKPCYLMGYYKKFIFGKVTHGEEVPLEETDVSWELSVFLKTGSEVSSVKEEALRFADACFRAERVGMRLIARAEQTGSGLSRKLEARGHASACVSVVMAHFIENDLVNDERYAERWLQGRLNRKSGRIRGPRLLSVALGNRGIGRKALKSAFDKVLDEETEFTLLQRFLTKRCKGNLSGAYSLRGRLRYEGFSSPVIDRYFEEAMDKNSLF